jgi:hypothetical protein
MDSDLPAKRIAGGILIGNLIITTLVIGSTLMLAAAVWIALVS